MKTWLVERPRATVVIVHGNGEHHGRYEWMIEQLNRQRFNVVSGDLPGHGRTRGKRGHVDSFDQYIEAVFSWYTEAAGYELPVFLFGHSMGGLITIRTLMEKRMRIRGVVLSSPCLSLYQQPGRMKDLSTKMLHRLKPTFSSKSGIQAADVTRNEEARASYETDEWNTSTVTVRWYQELIKAMKQSHVDALEFPDVSLLVMQAGVDLIVDKHATHHWFNKLEITDRSLREWKGLYHELLNEPEREEIFRFMMYFIHMRL